MINYIILCCRGTSGAPSPTVIILFVHRDKESNRIKFGYCAVCGWRRYIGFADAIYPADTIYLQHDMFRFAKC